MSDTSSDTPIEDELPMTDGSSRSRVSPLTIPLSAELRQRAQSELAVAMSPEEAKQLLFNRLIGYAQGERSTLRNVPLIGGALATVAGGDSPYTAEEAWFAAAISDLVVESLDDETRVDAVLNGVDLRPYIALAAQNPEAVVAQSQVTDVLMNANVGDPVETQQMILAGDRINIGLVAKEALTTATQQEIDLITQVRAESGLGPLTEADLAAINEISPDVVTAGPAARYLDSLPTTGGVNADGTPVTGAAASVEDILGGVGDEVLDDGMFFDRAQIEQWMRTGATTLDELKANQVQAEQEGVLEPGQAIYGFDVGQLRGGGPRRGPVREGTTMSVVDALDYLRTVDDAAFIQMQDQLAAAGYFQRLGVRPERGYQWDEATDQAWQLALTDSVKRGVGIPELLTQQRTELQTRAQQRFQTFSIKDTRFAANQLAVDVLGRNLTSDEYNVVRTFLQNLQNERRTDMAAGDPLAWLSEQTDMDSGLNTDDIDAAVEEAIGTKAYGASAFDGLQKLNTALGFTSNRPNDPQRED